MRANHAEIWFYEEFHIHVVGPDGVEIDDIELSETNDALHERGYVAGIEDAAREEAEALLWGKSYSPADGETFVWEPGLCFEFRAPLAACSVTGGAWMVSGRVRLPAHARKAPPTGSTGRTSAWT